MVVRLGNRRPGSQRGILRINEDRIGKCDRSVVPLRLAEGIVGKAAGRSAHAWVGDAHIRTLSGSEQCRYAQHTKRTRKTWQDGFEPGNGRNRRYRSTRITEINDLGHRLIRGRARLWISKVIEGSHVALSQQISIKPA